MSVSRALALVRSYDSESAGRCFEAGKEHIFTGFREMAKTPVQFCFAGGAFGLYFSGSDAPGRRLSFSAICRTIILRCGRRSGPGESFAIVPRHPFRRLLLQCLRMPQQLSQVIEWIYAVQFAGVNQAHE
jgi:hypothetical protein